MCPNTRSATHLGRNDAPERPCARHPNQDDGPQRPRTKHPSQNDVPKRPCARHPSQNDVPGRPRANILTKPMCGETFIFEIEPRREHDFENLYEQEREANY